MEIVGIERTTYTKKGTNEKADAIKFHLMGERRNVEGKAVETAFISSKWDCYNECLGFKIGDNVHVSYNRWGNIEGLFPETIKK
ncbi:MAG: hypothetical protein NC409_11450 [Clostridium sp.]|nr:hypothetical protein [Clostridium sp.]